MVEFTAEEQEILVTARKLHDRDWADIVQRNWKIWLVLVFLAGLAVGKEGLSHEDHL